jgi:hypothetical protein
MGEQQLVVIASALYRLPLENFVAARAAAAKTAAADSGRDLADDVRALPKPSVAAWAVNMLAVHNPDPLGQLAELGTRLRGAQADLDAAALRTLAQERRQLLNTVMDSARSVAGLQGRRLSATVAAEVEQTLRAATVDEGAAAAVRSGRLLRVLSADGVDRVDLSDAVAVPSVLTVPAVPPLDDTEARGSKGGATRAGTPANGAPAAASAEKPRLKAVRTERSAPTPSAVERAAARLAEAADAALAATEEAHHRRKEFEEADEDLARLRDEARSLRERLKVVDMEFEQARKRREAAGARMQLAARAAEKSQRAEMLARERVLRLRNTPD